MLVHQFTTFPYGGAGSAALRHHRALREEGIDSRLFIRRPEAGGGHVAPAATPEVLACEWQETSRATSTPWLQRVVDRRRRKRICGEYERHLRPRPPHAETFAQAELLESTRPTSQLVAADILHLHWVSYLLDYPSFFGAIPRGTPLVWTLHDMNPFTGGCHYADGCLRFRVGCGQCPAICEPGQHDVSRRSLVAKADALVGHQLAVVSPSRWLDRLARQSPIWPNSTEFHVVPYGLDLQTFCPMPRDEARSRWSLAQDTFLLGFVAEQLENPRKGFALLAEALGHLRAQLDPQVRLELLVIGRSLSSLGPLPIPVHRLGFLEPAALAAAYAATDLVILPSLEDNLPQTGLEAMACGRPVVGFETGGIPDFVIPGRTGALAKPGDPRSLAWEIRELLSDRRLRQRYTAGARRLMETEFELRTQTTRYMELYRELADRVRLPLRRAAA